MDIKSHVDIACLFESGSAPSGAIHFAGRTKIGPHLLVHILDLENQKKITRQGPKLT
jgi:hypothetical protein